MAVWQASDVVCMELQLISPTRNTFLQYSYSFHAVNCDFAALWVNPRKSSMSIEANALLPHTS
jgi:hypothetical protein